MTVEFNEWTMFVKTSAKYNHYEENGKQQPNFDH